MRRKLWGVMMLGVVFIGLVGCSKSVPSVNDVKEDLTGITIKASMMADHYLEAEVSKVTDVKIKAEQNNYEESKTAVIKADITFESEPKAALIEAEVEMGYDYFDQGGW